MCTAFQGVSCTLSEQYKDLNNVQLLFTRTPPSRDEVSPADVKRTDISLEGYLKLLYPQKQVFKMINYLFCINPVITVTVKDIMMFDFIIF